MDLIVMIFIKCVLPAIAICVICGLLWQWTVAQMLLSVLVMAIAIFLVYMIDGLIKLWYAGFKQRRQQKHPQD